MRVIYLFTTIIIIIVVTILLINNSKQELSQIESDSMDFLIEAFQRSEGDRDNIPASVAITEFPKFFEQILPEDEYELFDFNNPIKKGNYLLYPGQFEDSYERNLLNGFIINLRTREFICVLIPAA